MSRGEPEGCRPGPPGRVGSRDPGRAARAHLCRPRHRAPRRQRPATPRLPQPRPRPTDAAPGKTVSGAPPGPTARSSPKRPPESEPVGGVGGEAHDRPTCPATCRKAAPRAIATLPCAAGAQLVALAAWWVLRSAGSAPSFAPSPPAAVGSPRSAAPGREG